MSARKPTTRRSSKKSTAKATTPRRTEEPKNRATPPHPTPRGATLGRPIVVDPTQRARHAEQIAALRAAPPPVNEEALAPAPDRFPPPCTEPPRASRPRGQAPVEFHYPSHWLVPVAPPGAKKRAAGRKPSGDYPSAREQQTAASERKDRAASLAKDLYQSNRKMKLSEIVEWIANELKQTPGTIYRYRRERRSVWPSVG